MRLLSSDLALLAVLALEAAGELTLTDTARAIGAGTSSTQRALEVLVDDGIASRADGPARARYRLAPTRAARSVLELAHTQVEAEAVLAISARSSRAVEFLGRAPELVVVFAPGSRALEQARVARVIDRIGAELGTPVEYMDHDDVRRELLAHPEIRDRMAAATVLYGALDRSFPDRSAHGVRSGQPLVALHPTLAAPSKSAMRTLARRLGLTSLRVFGSAVRSDFRPDSDVDVLVGLRPGTRPTLALMAAIESELERQFGRDVDLVREEALRPEHRVRVTREAVALL
ncbi:MAG: nucleotidyltransferase family protein [Candidatus Dormibacteria bacterium]